MSSYSPPASPGFWSESAPSRSTRTSSSKDTDPPRPPKDGFEWVWFPDGYWAERPSRKSSDEDALATSGRPSKIFRWGSRVSKSPKDFPDRPIEHQDSIRSRTGVSPTSEAQHPLWQLPKDLPQSPYRSEQDQVAALQQVVLPMPDLRAAGPHVHDTWKIDAGAGVPNAEVLSPGARNSDAPGGSRLSWRKTFHKHNVSFLCRQIRYIKHSC